MRSGACYSAASEKRAEPGSCRAPCLVTAEEGACAEAPGAAVTGSSAVWGRGPHPQPRKAPLRQTCSCRKPSRLKDGRNLTLALEAGLGAGQRAEPGVCCKDCCEVGSPQWPESQTGLVGGSSGLSPQQEVQDCQQGRGRQACGGSLGHGLPVWGWRMGSPSCEWLCAGAGREGAPRPACVRVGAQAER